MSRSPVGVGILPGSPTLRRAEWERYGRCGGGHLTTRRASLDHRRQCAWPNCRQVTSPRVLMALI
eukprot:364552-Chlamydomonas_euryale.AAC.4